jgi:hypothetical protein
MGESTCAAKFYAKPVTAGGKARIEVSEMSKVIGEYENRGGSNRCTP